MLPDHPWTDTALERVPFLRSLLARVDRPTPVRVHRHLAGSTPGEPERVFTLHKGGSAVGELRIASHRYQPIATALRTGIAQDGRPAQLTVLIEGRRSDAIEPSALGDLVSWLRDETVPQLAGEPEATCRQVADFLQASAVLGGAVSVEEGSARPDRSTP